MSETLKICLTHDIDRVYKTYQYGTHFLKGNWKGTKTLFTTERPYWMFDKMADLETKYGAKSTLFFLHETIPFEPFNISNWKLSLGRYSVKNKKVAYKIREFDKYGWEIGLHGSYNSYRSLSLLEMEKAILEDVLGKKVEGVRQHYLNLVEPETWKLQKQAGFSYDASLGRTDGIGYKDERIKPFLDKSSGMHVLPLTLMECYLFNEAKDDKQKAIKLALTWMDHAQKNDVPFTILWHQRMFNEKEFPDYDYVYEKILQEAVMRNAKFLTSKEIYESFI